MRLDVIVLAENESPVGLAEGNIKIAKATAGIMMKAVAESNAKQPVFDWYSKSDRETNVYWVRNVAELHELKSKLLMEDSMIFSEVVGKDDSLEAISILADGISLNNLYLTKES